MWTQAWYSRGMDEITIHTGLAGERMTINIDWFNHNNNKRLDVLELMVGQNDKPRTLIVRLNGVEIGKIENTD